MSTLGWGKINIDLPPNREYSIKSNRFKGRICIPQSLNHYSTLLITALCTVWRFVWRSHENALETTTARMERRPDDTPGETSVGKMCLCNTLWTRLPPRSEHSQYNWNRHGTNLWGKKNLAEELTIYFSIYFRFETNECDRFKPDERPAVSYGGQNRNDDRRVRFGWVKWSQTSDPQTIRNRDSVTESPQTL